MGPEVDATGSFQRSQTPGSSTTANTRDTTGPTADLFPKVSILGSGGFRAAETGTWFDAVSRFWSIGPSLRRPVFGTGRTRANIEQKKALGGGWELDTDMGD